MRMDIQQFMNDYEKFREKNPFQENPGEEFITLEGKTDVKSQGLKWSDVTSEMFKGNSTRYAFLKDLNDVKHLWLFEKVGASAEAGATSGIVLQWNLERVIRDLKYDSSTDILALEVSTSAYFWRFSSKGQESSSESFSDYTGNIHEPISDNSDDPDLNMDTQSPIHPPTGIVNMRGPFE
jgi:hypothetical protein